MNNTPLSVDTGAHDESPAPGGAGNTVTGKTPFYLSKYFWTNLAALLALIIPDVRAWLDSNPIEFFSALGAVNILLQFISGGKYQLAGEDGQSGQSANPAGALHRLLPWRAPHPPWRTGVRILIRIRRPYPPAPAPPHPYPGPPA